MNDKPTDLVAETLREWTANLTVALNAAGFGCHYHTHTGSSSIRLGRLTVRKNSHAPADGGGIYHIDFERKLVVARNVRKVITQIEVYNPDGGLHVHIRNNTPEMVAKIVGYAQRSIEKREQQDAQREAQDRRAKAGWEAIRQQTEGWVIPDWCRISPNTDADDGTVRITVTEYSAHYPMKRLTVAQAKRVLDAIREVVCDHKFIDSDICLKCGWAPPPVTGWQPASVPVPADLQSTPMQVKMLLLAIEGREQPVRGYFMGGLVNEFYMEGSPSQWKPTHWMRMPDMPTTSSK